MNEIALSILSTLVTAVVLPLIIMAGNRLIRWLNTKIKQEKEAEYFARVNAIISSSVRHVMQTCVESFTNDGFFDEDAKLKTFELCKGMIEQQLTEGMKFFLKESFGDYVIWIETQIEAGIYTLRTTGEYNSDDSDTTS